MVSKRRMAISLKALMLVSLLVDGEAVLLAPSLASALRFDGSVVGAALVAWAVARMLDWSDRRRGLSPDQLL